MGRSLIQEAYVLQSGEISSSSFVLESTKIILDKQLSAVVREKDISEIQ